MYCYKNNWISILFKNFVSEQRCYWFVYANFVNFPTELYSQYRSNRCFWFVCFWIWKCFSVALLDFNLLGDSFSLMNLDVYFSLQIWEDFSHFCFKYTFSPFLLFFSFCSSLIANTVLFHCAPIPIAVFNLLYYFSFSLLSQ